MCVSDIIPFGGIYQERRIHLQSKFQCKLTYVIRKHCLYSKDKMQCVSNMHIMVLLTGVVNNKESIIIIK